MSVVEFYKEFVQDILARAGADQNFVDSVFTEHMCELLVDSAFIQDYTLTEYRKAEKSIRVDAWSYDEDSFILTLLITDFRHEASPSSVTRTDIEKTFRKAERFLASCRNSSFYQNMEETSPGYELAREIHCRFAEISRVQFILLTNGEMSKRVETIDDKDVSGRTATYNVWDIGRLHRLEASGKGREDILIDFTVHEDEGLACLPAFVGESVAESYLLVMPGRLLADLYDKYGERLLEQNVRTFLQFRGKVNKGIRNTILNEPNMFFAYNNGIAATAEFVQTSPCKTRLKSVRNLQIVNGGQTTASIFGAMRHKKANVDQVYVQVKLTVIAAEDVDNIVPLISEYANTQNKVNAADFFSNHPFHLRMEEFSRRIWAPSSEGGLRETHWFYERARGQYANAQSNLTSAKKKEFLAIHPKSQMFTKTDLAKFECCASMQPHIVSLGAQKNFIVFAEFISKKWEEKESAFNELYFKHLISKAILFRSLDRQIMKQHWYGGYKANIVAYTLAKLMRMAQDLGRGINLERIWLDQKLSQTMMEQLLVIAEAVNDRIQETPEGITNVTEWCKKEKCWKLIRDIDIPLVEGFGSQLVELEDLKSDEKHASKTQVVDNGIMAQAYVVNQGAAYWQSMEAYPELLRMLSPKEKGILSTACRMPERIPSEKQSKILLEIEKKAVEEGF